MFQKRIICIHALSLHAMSPLHFERYVVTMQRMGFRFVSLHQILHKDCTGKLLALTVDDAYKTCIVSLLPILEKYGIIATLFVPSGLIGLSANHEELIQHNCYSDEAMMDLEDLKLWVNKGQQLGFHTYKHINLKVTAYEKIEQDFGLGIEELHKWGIKIDLFAYPFGYLPVERAKFEQLLRKFGVKYAFTVKWGNVNIDEPYYINRVCIADK